jgi:hypothetical protein
METSTDEPTVSSSIYEEAVKSLKLKEIAFLQRKTELTYGEMFGTKIDDIRALMAQVYIVRKYQGMFTKWEQLEEWSLVDLNEFIEQFETDDAEEDGNPKEDSKTSGPEERPVGA